MRGGAARRSLAGGRGARRARSRATGRVPSRATGRACSATAMNGLDVPRHRGAGPPGREAPAEAGDDAPDEAMDGEDEERNAGHRSQAARSDRMPDAVWLLGEPRVGSAALSGWTYQAEGFDSDPGAWGAPVGLAYHTDVLPAEQALLGSRLFGLVEEAEAWPMGNSAARPSRVLSIRPLRRSAGSPGSRSARGARGIRRGSPACGSLPRA